VRRLLRVSALVLVVYVGLLALTGFMFQKVPAGFIPTMDQGYLIVFAQLPDGASLQRNDDVQRQIGEIGKNIPGVELTFAIEGLSIQDAFVIAIQPPSVRGMGNAFAANSYDLVCLHSWCVAVGGR
jgi:multidrug efflux pump subunit AcrB